ncbi:TetR/AcrR family transcriptional regulator [Nocardia sp. NPDC004722]
MVKAVVDAAEQTVSQLRRADAQRNRDRILAVAKKVFAEEGAHASLRDIARRAEVGLGTLYRHFPTRSALLAELLHDRFADLADRAAQFANGDLPAHEALREWLWEFSIGTSAYHDLPATMLDTLHDEQSPLHAECAHLQHAGQALLDRARQAGTVRSDVDSADLFALAAAIGWTADQSATFAKRRRHLFNVMFDGLTVR